MFLTTGSYKASFKISPFLHLPGFNMVELGTKYFPGKVTNSLNNIISAIIPTILITNVNIFNLGRFTDG